MGRQFFPKTPKAWHITGIAYVTPSGFSIPFRIAVPGLTPGANSISPLSGFSYGSGEMRGDAVFEHQVVPRGIAVGQRPCAVLPASPEG